MARVDPETVADRIEISDLMTRYAMAIDRCDPEIFNTVFTPDARLDYSDSGLVAGPRDEVAKILWEALAPFAGLHHNMTSHLCEISGGTAEAVTYFLAYHTVVDGQGGETILVMGGHYRDKLRKTPEGWRIVDRVELGTWMDGPYPEGVPRPPWYGKAQHTPPALPGDRRPR